MKDYINFMLNSMDQTEELKKLQSLLENTGIEANIITKEIGNQRFSFLNVTYDDEIVRIKKKRNAGRPYKGHIGRYTCGEIRDMQKTMSNREIAELLKLSERTFYRRLYEHMNDSDESDFS